MKPQHLSDEAVAAFADGVLSGHARDRAARHLNCCAECRSAVKCQREAALALRAAPAPSLPTNLLDRLRTVPMTTPLPAPPSVLAPDGSAALSTFAPMAAFAPAPPRKGRGRTYLTAAMVAGVTGALVVGGVVAANEDDAPGAGVHVVNHVHSGSGANSSNSSGVPVSVFRGNRP
jgi:hypothetical protein